MSLPWLIVAGLAAYLLWDDTVSKTQKALRKWTPEDCWDKELDFRSDLADFLRESLPEAYVVEEHGCGRGRRDIRIENKESEVSLAIELKYRMRTSNHRPEVPTRPWEVQTAMNWSGNPGAVQQRQRGLPR